MSAAVTAAGRQATRSYFYYISEQGHVYVIEEDQATMPHGPTHLKDRRAVNFLLRRLRHNDDGGGRFPWASACQGETNFFRAADRPIVFNAVSDQDDADTIYFGFGLAHRFQPDLLAMSRGGRLYHPSPLGWGLVSSPLLLDLADRYGLSTTDHGGFRLRGAPIPLIDDMPILNESWHRVGIDGRDNKN